MQKLLALTLRHQLSKCASVWTWTGLVLSSVTIGWLLASVIGGSGAALSSRWLLCLSQRKNYSMLLQIVHFLLPQQLLGLKNGRWIGASATHFLHTLKVAVCTSAPWYSDTQFPSWADLDASCFPFQQLSRPRLGADDGKGGMWRWMVKVERSKGAVHSYCTDRSSIEGRYMSVLGV